jgi:hypothetical protein
MFGSIVKTGFVTIILLTSCITKSIEQASTAEHTVEQSAQQALLSFLEDMHTGSYTKAMKQYGGSYETLIENNTNIQPNNHAALLENACTINGYQCLEVKTVMLEKNISPTEFTFAVEFLNEDGSLFMRGPCCGGNETDFPAQSSFTFTVIRDDEGNFLVMDLPPYVP